MTYTLDLPEAVREHALSVHRQMEDYTIPAIQSLARETGGYGMAITHAKKVSGQLEAIAENHPYAEAGEAYELVEELLHGKLGLKFDALMPDPHDRLYEAEKELEEKSLRSGLSLFLLRHGDDLYDAMSRAGNQAKKESDAGSPYFIPVTDKMRPALDRMIHHFSGLEQGLRIANTVGVFREVESPVGTTEHSEADDMAKTLESMIDRASRTQETLEKIRDGFFFPNAFKAKVALQRLRFDADAFKSLRLGDLNLDSLDPDQSIQALDRHLASHAHFYQTALNDAVRRANIELGGKQ